MPGLYHQSDSIFLKGNFFEIDTLITQLNNDKLGTGFFNDYGKTNSKQFLETYKKIPDSLKFGYLTIRDQSGNTILHYFARWGDADLVNKTFEKLTQLERIKCTCFQNDRGETPLHWVVAFGNKNTGLNMLKSIDDLDARKRCFLIQDNNGQVPLELKLELKTECIDFEAFKEDLKNTIS